MTDQGEDFPLIAIGLEHHRWFSDDGRAVQRLYASDQCDVIVVGWEPGQSSSYHDHGRSESVVYIVEGRITAISDGRSQTFEAGTTVITPRGTHHQMRNDGPDRAVTFHVYAPPMQGGVSAPYRDHTASDTER